MKYFCNEKILLMRDHKSIWA